MEQESIDYAHGIINAQREITEQELKSDELFKHAYKVAYKEVHGEYPEDGEDIAERGLQFVSDMTQAIETLDNEGMISLYSKFKDAPTESKQAMYYLIKSVDKKMNTSDGFIRGVKSLGKDVTTYAGIGMYNFFGKQAAKQASTRMFLDMLGAGTVGGMFGVADSVIDDMLQEKETDWKKAAETGATYGTVAALFPPAIKAAGAVTEVGGKEFVRQAEKMTGVKINPDVALEGKTMYRTELNDRPSIKNSRGGNFGKGLYVADSTDKIEKNFNGKMLEVDVTEGNYFNVDDAKEAVPIYNDYLDSIGHSDRIGTPKSSFITYKTVTQQGRGKEDFNAFLQEKGYNGIVGKTPGTGNQRVLFSDKSIKAYRDKK